MVESHVISALRAKRAEISGYIHDLEKKVRTWRARLPHIDASIKNFSPKADPEAIPATRTYRRPGYFWKGELARLCLDELRKADGKPITTCVYRKPHPPMVSALAGPSHPRTTLGPKKLGQVTRSACLAV
jgi:hypothetical protein